MNETGLSSTQAEELIMYSIVTSGTDIRSDRAFHFDALPLTCTAAGMSDLRSTMVRMGLYGRYARVTAAELDKALQDTKSAQDLRDRIFHSFYPDEGEVPPFSRDHLLNIDKAWDGLRYLLAAEGQAPVDPVLGGTPVSDDGQGGDSERYLTPSEVKEVAAYLRATPWERLASFFDPDTMMAARIYPEVWDRDHEDPIGYLRAYRDRLVAFFSAAAQAGDVVLLWIS